jgi:hypothetical protein
MTERTRRTTTTTTARITQDTYSHRHHYTSNGHAPDDATASIDQTNETYVKSEDGSNVIMTRSTVFIRSTDTEG